MAARVAYQENASAVARELKVTPQVLNAYERGVNFPDEHFLILFHELTGCPIDWIFLGKITAEMPPTMAARIGALFPHLVLGPGEGGDQAPEDGAEGDDPVTVKPRRQGRKSRRDRSRAASVSA